MRAKLLITLVIAVLLAAGGYYFWSQRSAVKAEKRGVRGGPVPVLAAQVERRPMPLKVRAVGSVTPVATVAVKSRVDGEIVQVGFQQGGEIKAGQMLFVIDPRALQAQLDQAEANLARDKALLATSRADVKRYTDLVRKNLVSPQELEKVQATLGQVQASIKADQAAVENYRVQLSYTVIRSPIDGRAGALLLDRGNMVKANDTNAMVVINQLKPIDVAFAVPERLLPAIRGDMAKGDVAVDAVVADDSAHPLHGVLDFIDNAADPTTATVQLRARFPNDDLMLWPGQFARVTLLLGVQQQALVVPAQAVQEGQHGSFVYVIQPDTSVVLRPVKVERVEEGDAVIADGLKAGETVVTEGQLRLAPGMKVNVRQPAAAAATEGAAGE